MYMTDKSKRTQRFAPKQNDQIERVIKIGKMHPGKQTVFSSSEVEILQTEINALNQTKDLEIMDILFEQNFDWALKCPSIPKDKDGDDEYANSPPE